MSNSSVSKAMHAIELNELCLMHDHAFFKLSLIKLSFIKLAFIRLSFLKLAFINLSALKLALGPLF